jgi:hypothetical protein
MDVRNYAAHYPYQRAQGFTSLHPVQEKTGPLGREAGLAISILGKTLPLCCIASPLPRNPALLSSEVNRYSIEGLRLIGNSNLRSQSWSEIG